MDRLVRLYRGASSPLAVASLVGANLIPLVGVLAWGWDLWTILALYWVENGVIGLWNIPKILLAEGGSRSQGPALAAIPAAAVAPFFAIHYGLFWVGHGAFVLVALPAFADGLEQGFGIRADLGAVAFGALWLTISHGISFLTVYVGRGEFRRVTPQAQAFMPYGRVVVLHLTIIAGGILLLAIGSPAAALVVLIGLKTALDLRFHIREHGAAPSGLGQPAVLED